MQTKLGQVESEPCKGPEYGPSTRLAGQVARPVLVTSPEVSGPGDGRYSSGSHPGLEMHGIGSVYHDALESNCHDKISQLAHFTLGDGLRGGQPRWPKFGVQIFGPSFKKEKKKLGQGFPWLELSNMGWVWLI